MMNKNDFVKIIEQHQAFEKGIERIEKALMGNRYNSNIFESDWVQAEYIMFDTILTSVLTNEGWDLVTWYLYEDVAKDIYEKDGKVVELNSIEDLYDYLITHKEDYFWTKNI